MFAMMTRPLAIAVIAGALSACGTSAPELDSSVRDPARRAYYEGMIDLVDGDYLEASQQFQLVAASPRTSKYAALAKLRLGDALFFQERFAEATEIYRGFTNQYKADPNLPYARFQVAHCYFKRLPSEWFISPPAHELDQTLTQQAEAELKGFLSQFPTSRFAGDARKMLRETRKMLFDHEMYAVDFYVDRAKWQAVAWRLSEAMETYPEFAVTDEGRVWQLSRAWHAVGQPGETAKALGLYLEKHPNGAHEAAAKAELEAIRQGVEKLTPKPQPKSGDDGLNTPPQRPPDTTFEPDDTGPLRPDGNP